MYNSKVIEIDTLLAESAAAAAMDFAAGALNSAVHKIIQESGAITRDEVDTISRLYEKVITEAIEEFVPSEEEIQKMIETLENAGYKVVKSGEAPAGNGAPVAGNGDTLNESADLASKIAAKLEIL